MASCECPICYDAVDASTGIATLSCTHSFHISCISGWFLKQEIGTCPCCRKEMAAIEDLPRADADEDEDEDEDDDDEEVEFTRAQLQAFMVSVGGNLTDAAAENICDVVASFTYYELNALVVGNTGVHLSEDRWNELLAAQEEDDEDEDEDEDEGEDEDDDEGEDVWNLRISTTFGADVTREVRMITTEDTKKAATKLQAIWRGFQGRVLLMEKRAIHILATMA